MDTSGVVERSGRRTRRLHSVEFKAQVVRACQQPGVSIAAVALANGLNANMLRRWVVEAERAAAMAVCGQGTGAVNAAAAVPSFVAVQMAASAAAVESDIHLELTRGPMKVVVRWPASLAGACASWLREILR